MKFCPECGTRRGEGARFCSECGFRFPAAPTPAAPRSVKDIATELQGLAARVASGELDEAAAGALRAALMQELAQASARSKPAPAPAPVASIPDCPVCAAQRLLDGPCEACGLPVHDRALLLSRQKKARGEQTRLRNMLTAPARMELEHDEPIEYLAFGEHGRGLYVLTDKRIVIFLVSGVFNAEHRLARVLPFEQINSYSQLDQHRADNLVGGFLQGLAEQGGHFEWSFDLHSSVEGRIYLLFNDDELSEGTNFHMAFVEAYTAHENGQPMLSRLLLNAKL